MLEKQIHERGREGERGEGEGRRSEGDEGKAGHGALRTHNSGGRAERRKETRGAGQGES